MVSVLCHDNVRVELWKESASRHLKVAEYRPKNSLFGDL